MPFDDWWFDPFNWYTTAVPSMIDQLPLTFGGAGTAWQYTPQPVYDPGIVFVEDVWGETWGEPQYMPYPVPEWNWPVVWPLPVEETVPWPEGAGGGGPTEGAGTPTGGMPKFETTVTALKDIPYIPSDITQMIGLTGPVTLYNPQVPYIPSDIPTQLELTNPALVLNPPVTFETTVYAQPDKPSLVWPPIPEQLGPLMPGHITLPPASGGSVTTVPVPGTPPATGTAPAPGKEGGTTTGGMPLAGLPAAASGSPGAPYPAEYAPII